SLRGRLNLPGTGFAFGGPAVVGCAVLGHREILGVVLRSRGAAGIVRRRRGIHGGRIAARSACGRSKVLGLGISGPGRTKSWRRPIFPKGCPLSIFGAGELDCRVRDGNGYGLSAGVTRILLLDVIGDTGALESAGRQ